MQDTLSTRLLFLVIILGLICHRTEGLWCYSCSDIGSDNNCEVYDAYKEARDMHLTHGPTDRPGIKECTPPFDQSCIIERFSSPQGEPVHIRDCSDDKTFNFLENYANKSSFQRLLDLKDNNESACVYIGGQLVCLSKCGPMSNYYNYCNGPQFNSGVIIRVSVVFLLLTVFCAYVFPCHKQCTVLGQWGNIFGT